MHHSSEDIDRTISDKTKDVAKRYKYVSHLLSKDIFIPDKQKKLFDLIYEYLTTKTNSGFFHQIRKQASELDEVKEWLDTLSRYFEQDSKGILDVYEHNAGRIRELMVIFLDDAIRSEIRHKAFRIVMRVIHAYFKHGRQVDSSIIDLFLFCLDVGTFKNNRE